jgi:hypothetical protein
LSGNNIYLGITFTYPSNNVTSMDWLGQGPYRVYKNRLAGQEVFTHTKSFNFGWTGQSTNYSASYGTPSTTQWTYPEFEGYHGQLYWATLHTIEQPITVVTPSTNLFLRMLTPPSTDIANVNPVYPSGTISFLDGINAIGDKFEAANATGPAGQVNTATGLYTREVNFYFGPLPASGDDRDGNGLVDAWEFTYFGAIGQNPEATADVDGLPLFVENAFDFAPTNANLGSPSLPHRVAGTYSPVGLAYSVPTDVAGFFSYIPQISPDLQTWYGADSYPAYFVITPTPNGPVTTYTVEPNLVNWPGSTNTLFLRLRIGAE